MEKILDLKIEELLQNTDHWKPEISTALELLTFELEDPGAKKVIHLEIFVLLKSILEAYPQDEDIWKRVLRVFRKASANSRRNQNLLFESNVIPCLIGRFLDEKKEASPAPCHALALQVIGNSIVGNEEKCRLVFSPETFSSIVNLIEQGEGNVREYVAMIGLTLTQCQPTLMLDFMDHNIIQRLLDHVDLEFVMLWLESLVAIPGILRKIYSTLDNQAKVKILHTFSENCAIPQRIPTDDLKYLILNFKSLAEQVLCTNANGLLTDFNVEEVTALVEIYFKPIHHSQHANYMKFDKSFVVTTIVLLRAVHEIGVKGNNCFSPIEKLEDLKEVSEIAESKPGFLFKADLIRLIGSLVEGVVENQDQVRELGVLPVILNCTKIDGRNPFIPQCSVVTLKFLLDENPQNQLYISQLEKSE